MTLSWKGYVNALMECHLEAGRAETLRQLTLKLVCPGLPTEKKAKAEKHFGIARNTRRLMQRRFPYDTPEATVFF